MHAVALVASNMERSIVAKENHHQTNNSDLLSKSMGSSIKIDSISIDLVSNVEIDAGKCEHFSIRGYVSEIRKKNWKICWPFALGGHHDKSEEQTCTLPPLNVSKFRWWHCQNCLQEIDAESIKNNEGNTLNYCSNTRFKSSGTCSHMFSLADPPVLQLDFHQAPKLNILEKRKVDGTIATNLNDNDCHPSTCNDKKEKKSESANTPIIGHEIGSEDNMSMDIPASAGAATGFVSGQIMGSNHTEDIAVAPETNCNASVELYQSGCGSYENAEVELTNKNLKSKAKNSAEICQTGKQPSADVKHLKVMVTCGTSGVANMVDEVVDAVKSRNECPQLEFGECDNASSESAETLAGNDLEDHQDDNSSGSHRRKARKVRLLTELLAENGDASSHMMREEKCTSNSVPDTAAEVAAPSTPQCPVPVQGNVPRGSDQNWKRKFPHDEEWRPIDISSQNNISKKDKTYCEGVETVGSLASSDSEEDAGTGLQIGMTSNLNKFRLDRSPTMGKKKNKRGLVVDEFLSLAGPSHENFQKDQQNKALDVNKVGVTGSVLPKSAHTTFTSRGMHPFPLPAQKTERNSNLWKKKSKVPLFDDGQASLTTWSNCLLGGSPVTGKDIESMQMPSLTAQFQSEHSVSTEKGLHLSLNMSTQGYERKYTSPLEDRLLLWQGGISKENQVMCKDIHTNYVGDSYFASKSQPDAYQRKVVNCDLSSNTYRPSFMNDKQKSASQDEAGSCSLMHQLDFCGRNNNAKSIQMLEHSAVPRQHSDQRADKISEQGVLDDIPMEIVELMAKNQYERCLPDVQNDNRPSETTNNTSNAQIAKGKLNLLLQDNADRPKPRAKNSKNGKITRAGSVGSSKKKSVDCFSHIDREHLNMRQLEPNSASMELRAFPQCQERPPSGVKFSDNSSSKHGISQNCQWIGNMLGPRSSQTNLQTLGACNTCQSVPQQNKETAHLWSSMMPNHVPFVYNISQKHADPSTNIDMLSHYPSSLHKGNLNGNHDFNFLNLNATNTEKHNRNPDSKNLSRSQAEHPLTCKHSRMGSLDLYSNETIPAMHLLSLMDARLRSGAPIDIGGTQKLPSFPQDHHSKDFSGLSTGAYKTSSAMKPPLYDYYGKNHHSESSYEFFAAIPTVGASGFSVNHDKGVKKNTGFTCQVSVKSQEKEKTKGFDSPSKNKSHRTQKSVVTTGSSGTNHGSIPSHSMQKMFIGTSDSMMFPLQCRVMENTSNRKLEACNTTIGVLPLKSSSKTEICGVNRNPADFSAPEAGNVYMIRGEDLKFRKTVFSENKSGLIKLNQHKRQRKLNTGKGKV